MLTPERAERVRSVAEARQYGQVVLQDVHDPHNIGAVMRTCEAFGLQRMSIIFEAQRPFNPKRVGTEQSTAANKWLDFDIFHSTAECLAALRSTGHTIVALVPSERAECLYEADLSDPRLALLIGNEHDGLTSEAMKLADQHVTIPMIGMVRSFNLSVSAGITLGEVMRQRRSVDPNGLRYRLPTEERAALHAAFFERAHDPKIVRALKDRGAWPPEGAPPQEGGRSLDERG